MHSDNSDKKKAGPDTSIFDKRDGGYVVKYKNVPYDSGPTLPKSNLPVAPKSPPKKGLKAHAKYDAANMSKDGRCISCGRTRCT